MRSTYSHIASRARSVILALFISLSLSAQSFVADGELLNAYLHNDMSAWQAHVDSFNFPYGVSRSTELSTFNLIYEYGFCGYIVSENKEAAKPYVKRFREHVEAAKTTLPKGHYEMYMSAVYVYELRIHESFHPAKAMSMAKDATKLAPDDPLTLSYYGTSLFYAPTPFGSKKEALEYFLRAEKIFRNERWYNCWVRPATMMYIAQCYDKLGNTDEAIKTAQQLLDLYPDYEYIKYDYLPALIRRTQ